MPNQQIDDDTTRATARLPGLEVEIVHRRSPAANVEQISINLQAVPSFEVFGQFLQTANPFAFWAQAAQMAWFPWLMEGVPALRTWPRRYALRRRVGNVCKAMGLAQASATGFGDANR